MKKSFNFTSFKALFLEDDYEEFVKRDDNNDSSESNITYIDGFNKSKMQRQNVVTQSPQADIITLNS
jgi:hypothetical protein